MKWLVLIDMWMSIISGGLAVVVARVGLGVGGGGDASSILIGCSQDGSLDEGYEGVGGGWKGLGCGAEVIRLRRTLDGFYRRTFGQPVGDGRVKLAPWPKVEL
jgi:hypothetical protein